MELCVKRAGATKLYPAYLCKVNKHVRLFEPDLVLPVALKPGFCNCARFVVFRKVRPPRRVVGHFAILLITYTYKGHGHPKICLWTPGRQPLMHQVKND